MYLYQVSFFITYMTHKSPLREKEFAVVPSSRVQPNRARKSRRQECELTDHISTAVRVNRETNALALPVFSLLCGPDAHRRNGAVHIQAGLPTSVILAKVMPQTCFKDGITDLEGWLSR